MCTDKNTINNPIGGKTEPILGLKFETADDLVEYKIFPKKILKYSGIHLKNPLKSLSELLIALFLFFIN